MAKENEYELPVSYFPSIADMNEPLLPRRAANGGRQQTSRVNTQSTARLGMPVRSFYRGSEYLSSRRKVSWMRITKSGDAEQMEVDKTIIMKRYDLPGRDLRLLDPQLVYPATILGREKAIVVNLEESVKSIITAEEVVVLYTIESQDFVEEMLNRLTMRYNVGDGNTRQFRPRSCGGDIADADVGGSCAEDMPFEFRALEVALEKATSNLETQATQLENELYPVVDALPNKISTLNLEIARKLKSRLIVLTRKVQKVRDEIEQLMDDDGDMAEMYLTYKKDRGEEELFGDHGHSSLEARDSVSAPSLRRSTSLPDFSVGSPSESRKLEKSSRLAHSRHESAATAHEDIEELEMLLEAYFVVIDGTLNKLTSLKEYIDDTEDLINIQLDNVRNQLIQFELLLSTAAFIFAIYGVIAGVFGMNIPIGLYHQPHAFKWVIITSAFGGMLLFSFFLWYFKQQRLIFL